MQKHSEITRQRLQTFAQDRGFKRQIYPEQRPVKLFVYHATDRITFEQAMLGNYDETHVGVSFGPAWSTHWFRVEATIPNDWQGKEIHFLWDSSSEACVWIDGKPIQGLTGSGVNPWEFQMVRPAYRLSRAARGGERMVFYIEMACNGLFGSEPGSVFPLKKAEIVVFDQLAWDLYWDFVIIADMAKLLPVNTPRAGQALWTANEMINTVRLDDRATWDEARKIASVFLHEHNGDSQLELSAIGYAHLDTAWLWPLAETKRKAVRTFTTTLRLMEDYPHYKFANAQAQHLAWIKELHPDLYVKLKEQILQGNLDLVGGTWVEPDCNIPSGESLVRQFLFGQRFYQQEFGITCTQFWNPDVFGYSGALPQIMRGAGMNYFLTQKLSWNQINKPANHTFIWEGIDGSQVLTHFPPGDTYGSAANVADVLKSSQNFKEHDRARESILIYGWGDGGGGPTPEMLEQISRMGDVDGLPRVTIRSVEEFFARCEADIKQPAVWVGELYFELHRGTYTTQAANKRDNRRSEFLLRDIELLASLAHIQGIETYPASQLDELWKLVLLNQFHDILPGSSINMVYQDSAEQYAWILEHGRELRAKFMQSLFPEGESWIAFNTLSSSRREIVELPFELETIQQSADGKPLALVDIPSMGYVPIAGDINPGDVVTIEQTPQAYVLENSSIRAVVQKNGSITSLYDKALGREAILEGGLGNRFVLYDDDPINFEAWDVDIYHLEKAYPAAGASAARIRESGPLRVAVEFEYTVGEQSSMRQVIYLTAASNRLDFDTDVDWHEEKRFLKVEFQLDIRSELATYEIQFGHVQRPTHFNTSYDLARFEVCAHRWADFSEPGFGVALLNDSKYGYSVYRNVMRLSLLRSPKSPDPEADMGFHSFRYALKTHSGSFRESGIIEEGYRFNVPVVFQKTKVSGKEGLSYFSVNRSSVVIDTIKKAEDSNDLIVRLYEAHGGRGEFRLISLIPFRSVHRCNLLEQEESQLPWENGGVTLTIKPFEILTLKLSK